MRLAVLGMAVAQGVADAGRRELVAGPAGHRLGDRDAEALLVAIGLHAVGAAGAALAERDVEPRRHMLHAQSIDQNLFDELLVREAGHLEVERQQIEDIHAHSA
jgi:hypothetical protein